MADYALAQFPGAKILAVDDDTSIRTALKRFVENNGCEFIEAATGEEGLERVQGADPQIVLLDISLPDRNGLEVLQEIRKTSPHTCVIMMSSWAEDFVGTRLVELGAFGFLAKPIDLNKLSAILWAILTLTSPE